MPRVQKRLTSIHSHFLHIIQNAEVSNSPTFLIFLPFSIVWFSISSRYIKRVSIMHCCHSQLLLQRKWWHLHRKGFLSTPSYIVRHGIMMLNPDWSKNPVAQSGDSTTFVSVKRNILSLAEPRDSRSTRLLILRCVTLIDSLFYLLNKLLT